MGHDRNEIFSQVLFHQTLDTMSSNLINFKSRSKLGGRGSILGRVYQEDSKGANVSRGL